jgi:uncharacterized protein (UPF0303 family)
MKPSADLVKIIEEHERNLVFPMFDADQAFALGLRARERFLASPRATEGKGVVIAIELFDGHTLFRCAVGGGLGPDNWCASGLGPPSTCIRTLTRERRSWVARKLNTVRRFGRSSFLVGRQNSLRTGAWHVDTAEYADHGGAFPIRIKVRYIQFSRSSF